MDKLQQFLVEVGWLWLATAAVVAVASAIHYALSRSELKALKDEMKMRGTRYQPKRAEERRE